MKPLGSVAAVVAAIREDASAEAEALDCQAQAEIDRIRTSEASDVVTIPDRERKLAAARQHARVRLAHEDWERHPRGRRRPRTLARSSGRDRGTTTGALRTRSSGVNGSPPSRTKRSPACLVMPAKSSCLGPTSRCSIPTGAAPWLPLPDVKRFGSSKDPSTEAA